MVSRENHALFVALAQCVNVVVFLDTHMVKKVLRALSM